MPKILIISSVDPTRSAGVVALNFYNAFKKAGIEADFLTKHAVPSHPEFLHILPAKNTLKGLWLNLKSKKCAKRHNQRGNHAFDFMREDCPPVPVNLVTDQIKKQYDAVFIVFWYQLISYKTVKAIWDKLHCQIHLRCPDNQVAAGGCHFIGGCPRLSEGCGMCPGLRKEDFTAFNVEYRRSVLKEVRPLIYGNTHMQRIYCESALLRDYDRLITAYPLVDNSHFRPMPKEEPYRDKFVLFFGSTILNEERKGMKYLIKALEIFKSGLKEEESKRVLLLVAGRHQEEITPLLPFAYEFLGFIPFERLPQIYNNADAYLSPSIDDAGPSMVNQAISCGTPVVAFNIGTALDMIQEHNTGYCAQKADAEDFAKGIEKIFRTSASEYKAMSDECRALALERTSDEGFVKSFLEIYRKYQ